MRILSEPRIHLEKKKRAVDTMTGLVLISIIVAAVTFIILGAAFSDDYQVQYVVWNVLGYIGLLVVIPSLFGLALKVNYHDAKLNERSFANGYFLGALALLIGLPMVILGQFFQAPEGFVDATVAAGFGIIVLGLSFIYYERRDRR